MIPTTVTNSPPSASVAQNGATAIGGAGAAGTSATTTQTNYSSIVLGLASLILEGRSLADDEYQQHQQTPPLAASTLPSQQVRRTQRTRDWLEQQAVGSVGGRSSPRPSTSRATLISGSGSTTAAQRVINITTNPYAMSTPLPSYGYAAGASSAASSAENTSSTHRRWTQKLCQLRQVSPAAQTMSAEPELVALAMNQLNSETHGGGGGDFEIVRRVMLNRSSGNATANTSAASSPGSGSGDNILHSLQSLATTCLRGGPAAVEHTLQTRNLNLAFNSSSFYTTPPGAAVASGGSSGYSPQYRNPNFLDFSRTRSEVPSVSTRSGTPRSKESPAAGTTPQPTTEAVASTGAPAPAAAATANTRPKHGPHCDQFLRKMGLAKGEAADAEEHICDMSYVNGYTCSRWRAYCLKIEAILARRQPICIEVYLGPVGHKILLEQWIITGKEKVPPPTMTLPSLCSAIRSQLYFSQIVAWCDLLRKSDQSTYDAGRVIFSTGSSTCTTNAGDLATPTHSGNMTTTSSNTPGRPRLNIFYRIKQYDPHVVDANADADLGFRTKVNVHNFPHVNIAENLSISVCVKSLPRINGGIPRLGPSTTPSTAGASRARQESHMGGEVARTPTCGGQLCADIPMGARSANGVNATDPARSCDSSKAQHQQPHPQSQSSDELDKCCLTLSHRERQLQKYYKRIQRRDKKRERKPSSEDLELQLQPEPMDDEPVSRVGQRRSIEMISTGTQTSLSSCRQCGSEKTLLCLNCNIADDDEDLPDTASEMEELDESSCSLSSSDIIVGTPRNKAELLLQAIQRTPKNKKQQQQQRERERQQQLAVQQARNDLNGAAMRQTNNNHVGQHKVAPTSGCQVCKRQKTQHNFGNSSTSNVEETPMSVASPTTSTIVTVATATASADHANEDDDGDGKPPRDSQVITTMEQEEQHEERHEKAYVGSTKLTPQLERCSLLVEQPKEPTERCFTPPANTSATTNIPELLPSLGADFDEGIVVQFKTPTSNLPLKLQESQLHCGGSTSGGAGQRKQTPKPSLLRINCSGTYNLLEGESQAPLLLRKALPKVNLTTIFCNSSASALAGGLHSAPISIGGSSGNLMGSGDNNGTDMAFSFEPDALNHSQSQSTYAVAAAVTDSNIPVQKSYSAPTLPNSLSLSPRFAKQASFYKRRSRHLSDRSDRSSLGSDEQLSDEDFESSMCSPATSPLKSRSLRLTTLFGRRPLLGNLEESLLQKRLLPKVEVMGFKVLLGASGGFCPTQLTIPAVSYFYELHGETLSTPYLCEIRLPRKGYFVPRTGTVQATLLNPMGTVVRMFVIPYDMSDMPPLHRTFIRQRILAEECAPSEASSSSNLMSMCNGQRGREKSSMEQASCPSSPAMISSCGKLGHFISAEQMKRLRYSIHLRFQTSRSGRLSLHTDIRLLISRRTDCDTAAAHAKGVLEAPNELITDNMMPTEPRYSARQESPGKM
ncbi:uncharacterized protein LOC115623216 [Scaptodrosophila lebanonensis]|uniref:Uncharacterized protein LOC115623216 n=1 Tax=Drosophila lebanonensis TaxID=7225 RepID=A0A6J2TEA2_DROLE|nr:uncharacterized protein LOC115623216 [Scaptodrosophila lebanonensis]XP_030373325.1 uncharacterized protein LOC115623216 [Scaptodrosophila lebanonensis]XP_030373335.1 uncharacterized protein LOC115623216 [Scaptodrosophila lebanonensis]XP_030373342.1 uncharacterized protein LOC115623216 [Scaptodrosophila lebanonensis]